VTGDTNRRCNRTRSSSLGLLLAAISVTAAAECSDRLKSLKVAFVSDQSDWSEFDTSGRKLVHESGKLHGPELSFGLRCADWEFLALASQLDGSRMYDGQTSTGVPIISSSEVRQRKSYLQAGFNLADTWQMGGRLSSNTIWRELASAGGASGYAELYYWTTIALGTQWETGLGRNRFKLAAWFGRPVMSTMELTLPGRDQATLKLGSMNQAEFAAGWRTPIHPSWYLEADVQYRRTAIGQGEDAVITRGGMPVAVAHQPQTLLVDVPVAVRIGYDF
jgi:hypothetical protein